MLHAASRPVYGTRFGASPTLICLRTKPRTTGVDYFLHIPAHEEVDAFFMFTSNMPTQKSVALLGFHKEN